MHLKNTAKFGVNHFNNNESIMDRFQTQITEHIGRSSEMLIQGNSAQMNVEDLEASKDFILVNQGHRIPQNPETTYRCQICDRLRAICPYKSYKTYDYCQKCSKPEQVPAQQIKRNRPRIFDSLGYGASKDLNSTYNETKGHLGYDLSNGHKHLEEVNKVRFVQTNNMFPIKSPVGSNHQTFREEVNLGENRKRVQSTYELKRPSELGYKTGPVNHQVIREPVYAAPQVVNNVEEIIFYPVIHNKLVNRSAERNESAGHEHENIRRSRYHSQYGGKGDKRRVEKVVSDFLQSTQPDEVLTPSQFKRLADSIYREQNPNVEEQQGNTY